MAVAITHTASLDELRAERCRRRLSVFVRDAWPILEPATPFVHGWHVDCVCEHLEAVTAGELPRLIINIPPRMMKSLLAAVCWPAWEWLSRPATRWMFASYAADLAWRDSRKTRLLIKSRGGRHDGTVFQRLGYQGVVGLLAGDDEPWSLARDQDTKGRFENTEMGFRVATSVDGQATGEGGDRIVVDDAVNAREARSEAARVNANLWWDETMTTRFNQANATATIIMQRLHEEDLTGHLLQQDVEWHHLCLPGEYEPSHPFVYPERVVLPERSYNVQAEDGGVEKFVVPAGRELPGDPRTRAGELLEPVRLGPEKLRELLAGLMAYGYAGQIQQRPAPAEGGMFKRGDMRTWWLEDRGFATFAVLNTDDGLKRYDFGRCTRFATIDVAGSAKETADYTVIAVWAITPDGHLLLVDLHRQHFDELDVPGFIRRTMELHPGVIPYVERLGFGSGYIKQLQRQRFAIGKLEADRDKVTRALPAVVLLEAHLLFFPRKQDAEWLGEYIEELATFPLGAHDDQVDVTAYAARKMLELAQGKRDPDPNRRPTAHRPQTAGLRARRF